MSSGFADRIHFTGFVSDAQLLELYNACDCFVFPSFYEGFGLPILEAMACGRAVACSNTSAMPEVADGAGILFDPHSVDAIKRAMADILLDPELRARKERLGLQRAARSPGRRARARRWTFTGRWWKNAAARSERQRVALCAVTLTRKNEACSCCLLFACRGLRGPVAYRISVHR